MYVINLCNNVLLVKLAVCEDICGVYVLKVLTRVILKYQIFSGISWLLLGETIPPHSYEFW